MWEIWEILLLPKALKSCPKSNKSPNLVALFQSIITSGNETHRGSRASGSGQTEHDSRAIFKENSDTLETKVYFNFCQD